MKVLLVGDLHLSEHSSIIRSIGKNYTTRIENCLKTIDWIERQAEEKQVDRIIYLGDFFDKPDLSAQLITALQQVKWNKNIPHHFVVGNHESGVSDLSFNSTKVLQSFGFHIISSPQEIIPSIFALPYITEDKRKPLSEYVGDNDYELIVSHNDIKGINYGPVESKQGFVLTELDKYTNYTATAFVNGHLHNYGKLGSYIYNLGNITGQNFGEDAFKYPHHIMIFEGHNKIELIENPHAFNFYKLEINNEKDLEVFNTIKNNAVATIKVNEKLVDKVKEICYNNVKIVESRLLVVRDTVKGDGEIIELNNVDHLQQFKDFVLKELGSNELVLNELSEILK